ncbi:MULTISPECIES: PUA domain-containing protein [Acidilobus]|uniref:PUA domain-containing protein n=1 Tax=Acidilobus TaxID=105850 RepID=UPI0013053744|nr:PUA domain-containing protein [Acidilobus saccharovorans]
MSYLLALQFNEEVAAAITSLPLQVELRRGKIRYVYYNGVRLMTLRPRDFTFSISPEAGKIIKRATEPPRFRVIVSSGSALEGEVTGNSVLDADKLIRPGDEVLIVDVNDSLLGVGKAKAPGFLMRQLGPQEVVRFRRGVED